MKRRADEDLNRLLKEKNFSFISERNLKANNYKPNDVLVSGDTVIIIAYMSTSGGAEYSLNKVALMDALDALKAGRRRAAFVAVAETRPSGRDYPKFENWMAVNEVNWMLRNAPTLEGRFHGTEYWWIDSQFRPSVTRENRPISSERQI